MRLTVQDAAELLGVSEKSIYRWIKQGTLPVYRVNDMYRFNRAELLAWATSRRLNVSSEIFHEPHAPGSPLPTLAECIQSGGIIYRVEGRDKDSVLTALVDHIRLPEEIDREYLLRMLMARENLGSTGLGRGVAVPQLLYPNALEISRPVVTLAFLEEPVDYEALDARPVETLFALVSPTLRAYYHLFHRLIYALGDPEFERALRERSSRDRIMDNVRRLESGMVPR